MIGSKYGKWTIIGDAGSRDKKHYYLCECECKKRAEVDGHDLRSGRSSMCRSCAGRMAHFKAVKTEFINVGNRYGKWIVLEELPTSHDQRRVYRCKCDCGIEAEVVGYALRSGRSLRCQNCGNLDKVEIAKLKESLISASKDYIHCVECKKERPKEEFFSITENNKLLYKHKLCFISNTSRWHKLNPEAKQKYVEQQKIKSEALRQEIDAIKINYGCKDCGFNRLAEALHFDHLPEFEKLGEVSKFVSSNNRDKAFEEIKKCEVVCATCHTIRTVNRRTQH